MKAAVLFGSGKNHLQYRNQGKKSSMVAMNHNMPHKAKNLPAIDLNMLKIKDCGAYQKPV